jgi:ribosomal protein L3
MLQSLRLLLLLHTLYHTPSITPFPAFSLPPQFYKDGLSLPATVIAVEAGNIVTQVKTADKDGYAAVQVRAGRHAGTGRQAVAGRQAACLRSPNSALAHRVQNSKLCITSARRPRRWATRCAERTRLQSPRWAT